MYTARVVCFVSAVVQVHAHKICALGCRTGGLTRRGVGRCFPILLKQGDKVAN